jgi:hypothetical protein
VRQKLCRRLEELEKTSARAWPARACDSAESGIAKVREILRVNNVQQGSNESLMETFARFLGISSWELRNRLMEKAYGHRRGVAA